MPSLVQDGCEGEVAERARLRAYEVIGGFLARRARAFWLWGLVQFEVGFGFGLERYRVQDMLWEVVGW